MPQGSNSVGVCVVRTVERQDTAAPAALRPRAGFPPRSGETHPWFVFPAFPWVSGTSGFAVAENYLGHASPQALMTSRSRRTVVVGGHTPVRKRAATDRPRPTS